MTQSAPAVRANPLFYVVGFVVILIGFGMALFGVAGVFTIGQRYDSPLHDGRAELVLLATLMLWGFLVVTIGRIIWRGARRRGVKDRVGRLLMIIGWIGGNMANESEPLLTVSTSASL